MNQISPDPPGQHRIPCDGKNQPVALTHSFENAGQPLALLPRQMVVPQDNTPVLGQASDRREQAIINPRIGHQPPCRPASCTSHMVLASPHIGFYSAAHDRSQFKACRHP